MATALVTGASSGIGKATAMALLKDGLRVFVAARRIENMADLVKAGATAIAMDITDEDQVRAAVDLITDEAGGVDVLVNNAGFALYGAMEDTSIEDARYQFEVNLFGLAHLTQLVLPYMRKQGQGRIINVSSIGGKIYTPMGSWYHATKHALEGWSDALRLEVAPFGIDVIIIEPGLIETALGNVLVEPLLQRSGKGPYADVARAVAKRTKEAYRPGRSSPPEVVAEAIGRAVRARRPKTRYVVGTLARPSLFLRRILSDRLFDRVVMSRG